jgi:hypothetical protein
VKRFGRHIPETVEILASPARRVLLGPVEHYGLATKEPPRSTAWVQHPSRRSRGGFSWFLPRRKKVPRLSFARETLTAGILNEVTRTINPICGATTVWDIHAADAAPDIQQRSIRQAAEGLFGQFQLPRLPFHTLSFGMVGALLP